MPSKYRATESGYLHQSHSGKKNALAGTDADLNMETLRPLFADEEAARRFVESKRWPNGPVCPHCGGTDVWPLTARPGSRRPVRSGVYKCRACREQFTVRVGTVMEDSKIKISKWLMAIHLMTSSKKGISSHQVARQLDVTQKTAWSLCHRIREAMREDSGESLLDGTVEVDETYVGGKPRVPGTSKRGRGTSKSPVSELVQRNGGVRSMPIDSI
jgi:transposase-like protein